MISDLAKAVPGRQSVFADVAIVGGGLAGLLLAARFRRSGLGVVVLESGGRTQEADRHPLNEVVQNGQIYGGAEKGRFRCFGGTSTRWGGAMLPFKRADLSTHPPGWDAEWPLELDELSEHFEEVERLFALPAGPYVSDIETGPYDGPPDFTFRSAKWPSFRMRNIAHVLRSELGTAGPEVWLNATATEFHIDEAGRLSSVTASAPGGRELTVSARCIVLAAGAIESTRLLLLLDRAHQGRIFGNDSSLGRYFHDHLSAECCRVRPIDKKAFFARFGISFVRGGMRDCRMEPSDSVRRRLGVPGGFAHVTMESMGSDGFTALRAIYRAAQRKSVPSLRDLAPLIGSAGWFAQAAYWRFVKGRLLPPPDAVLRLMLVIEQMPHPENRITLSPDRRDVLGVPMAQISWRIRPPDIEGFRTLQAALVEYWKMSGFDSLALATSSPFDVWRRQLDDGGVVHHPGGSTRMGRTKAQAVVDRDLRTFAFPNVFVVSTSVFPTGGSANPSFMLLAFALRAADRIMRELRH